MQVQGCRCTAVDMDRLEAVSEKTLQSMRDLSIAFLVDVPKKEQVKLLRTSHVVAPTFRQAPSSLG